MPKPIQNPDYTHSRLRVLQSLCSSSDPDVPYGLLILPGIDGRNNKGSAALLKYLLMGSIGKDLVDASLDGAVEDLLGEIVVLILESSVSVFWTKKARREIGMPLLLACPMLVEYISSVEDDVDLDIMQESKCREFKRMILEGVPAGEAVGVTLPAGYDELAEVEGWPLLQAFALDENICSTGFLSMRYTLVDVTENIDVMMKAVDGFVLENAIDTVTKSVLPHVHQMLNILDTRTTDKRADISMADFLAPLDILFDFGEIAAGYPVDPELRCTALAGSHSKYFGLGFSKFEKLANIKIGSSPHIVLEGCEPSTGMRFCRTYFMSTGRALALHRDPESLTDDMNGEVTSTPDTDKVANRLKALYFKLSSTLRWAMRATTSTQSDVFDVANEVRRIADAVMKGKESMAIFGPEAMRHDLDEIRFNSEDGEEMKVHIDCMNAFGQLVTIDDIDDMGGQCFVYIRLTLHNIPIDNDGTRGVIGVGDTFVFSPGYAPLNAGVSSLSECMQASSVAPLTEDFVAITSTVPYFKFFIGHGEEEKSALHLVANLRNAHMLPLLGLQGAIQNAGESRGGLIMHMHVLTDNAFMPLAHTDVKAFQEGFVIERWNNRALPMLVSFKLHVEEAWSCDVTECQKYAQELWARENKGTKPPHCDTLPSGIALVLRLRAGVANPLDALPTVCKSVRYSNQHIAFIIGSQRSQEGINGIIGTWRKAMRMYDVVEHRGNSLKDHPLPQSFLRSFTDSIAHWAMVRARPFSGIKAMPGMLSVSETKIEPISTAMSTLSADESWQIACNTGNGKAAVGEGYVPMVTTFSVAEARRLQLMSAAPYGDDEEADESDLSTIGAGVKVTVVVGQTGSGILAIASQIQQRVNRGADKKGNVQTELAVLDLNTASDGNQDVSPSIFSFGASRAGGKDDSKDGRGKVKPTTLQALSACMKGKPKQLVLAVLTSPINRMEPAALLNLISSSGASVALIAAVVNAKSAIKPFTCVQSIPCSLGLETWKASCLELCHWGLCDYVLVVDEDDKSIGSSGVSAYSEICDWLSTTNAVLSNESIHRLASGNTWLDSDFITAVTSSFASASSIAEITRQSRAARNVRGICQTAGTQALQALTPRKAGSADSSSVPGINSYRIKPSTNVCDLQSVDRLGDLWDLELLTQFLQWLFPRATLNTSTAIGKNESGGSLGYVRRKKLGEGSWRRATDLAVFQAVAGLRDKLGKANLRERLKELKADAFGVLSVHGIVRINRSVMYGGRSAQACFEPVTVEATAGAITLRPYTLRVSNDAIDSLVCSGVLDTKNRHVLREILSSLCTIHEIPRTPHYSRSDLSEKVLIDIQRRERNHRTPLPDGWWFDGSAYFDVYGNRRVLRPDIEDMAKDYIRSSNDAIDQYNAFLDQGDSMLLQSL